MTNLKVLKAEVLDISRQNQTGKLSEWFDERLNTLLQDGNFPDLEKLNALNNKLIDDLVSYKNNGGVNTVVLGMSGGVDSAVTAALFKKAGWRVIGVTMPIHQDQSETDRGIVAIEALDLEAKHLDLSDAFDSMCHVEALLDPELDHDTVAGRIRRGNIRARLRMITLYNLAAAMGGLVASTDNFSELAAGFWTLHGDVGDLSPIQSLTKSWEVPMLAKLNGVPEETWRAKPTDGLGIDDGDEAQFGFTYLELDIMLITVGNGLIGESESIEGLKNIVFADYDATKIKIADDERASYVYDEMMKRVGSTWFKRKNPINLKHPLCYTDRYDLLDRIDDTYFVPNVAR